MKLSAFRARGFTLLELLIVITIIAVASAVVSLSLRDPNATRLEREGQRLATLLEAARAQSRAVGVPVQWRPINDPRELAAGGARVDFRFDGLPTSADLPQRWLGSPDEPPVQVELPLRQRALTLGPEPVIGAQRLLLRLGDQQMVLATDGLGPFMLVAP
ncbi:MAG: prepilin-type N-terminal cleavage/methylation domain-containing protein [Burkholderiales bacterium]